MIAPWGGLALCSDVKPVNTLAVGPEPCCILHAPPPSGASARRPSARRVTNTCFTYSQDALHLLARLVSFNTLDPGGGGHSAADTNNKHLCILL